MEGIIHDTHNETSLSLYPHDMFLGPLTCAWICILLHHFLQVWWPEREPRGQT